MIWRTNLMVNFFKEMENLKTKNQVLKTERDKEVAKHEEEIAEIVDRNSRNVVDIGELLHTC